MPSGSSPTATPSSTRPSRTKNGSRSFMTGKSRFIPVMPSAARSASHTSSTTRASSRAEDGSIESDAPNSQTGRNAATGEPETPAAPDSLRALFNVRTRMLGKQQWDIRIRDEENRPLWLIYPGRGRGIDVVAIPVPMTGNEPMTDMYPINPLLSKPLRIKITDGRFHSRLPVRQHASFISPFGSGAYRIRARFGPDDHGILLG
jgi:hypothetical protein